MFAIIALCLLLAAQVVSADQGATTEDGRKVLLRDDGTWEYVKEQEIPQSGERHFRGATWGMSKQQVKKTEKATLVKEEKEILAYKAELYGLSTVVGYVFVDEKLVRGTYIFTDSHTNKNDYIEDYSKMKKVLEEKYGPVKEDILWKNNLYKDDPQQYGFAIGMGHLVLDSNWKTPDTDILLSVRGENFEIQFRLQYKSRKIGELEEIEKKKKAKDDL